MSRFTHLPIYVTAFAILKELYIRVPKFGTSYKHTLGNRMLDIGQEIVVLVIQANNNRETRIQKINDLLKHAETLTILARIADELNLWGGEKIYISFAEKVVSLSKQSEGWRKSLDTPSIGITNRYHINLLRFHDPLPPHHPRPLSPRSLHPSPPL